ncbi:MAG: prolyl oligopeptidase family serine peptidase [Prevotellaceae bacterium]|jgi:dipeptidyl aminopeptidase/acylaminoacyl peptidase|nr:prolyl oligopeptidase family serine peptidase [Prevotellaceae bacterium]
MIKRIILIASVLLCAYSLAAREIPINEVLYAGPYKIAQPYMVDSLNVKGEKYGEKEMVKTPVSFVGIREQRSVRGISNGELKFSNSGSEYAIHIVGFYVTTDRYAKGTLNVDSKGRLEVYVNGKPQAATNGKVKLTLEPRRYEIIIKYLQKEGDASSGLTLEIEDAAAVTAGVTKERVYTINDVFDGKRIQSASISPNGKYVLIIYQTTFAGGKQVYSTEVMDMEKNVILSSTQSGMRWMPKSNLLYYTRQGMDGKELVTLDPITKAKNILAANLPDGSFTFAPTEDFLLFTIREKGPEKDKDLQEIIVPDDRQPGWRDRSFIHKYDLKTGVLQRLTYGHSSTSINDISEDGRYLLFSIREPVLTERPFTRASLYRMDLQTLQVETILNSVKFVSRAVFSPDMKQLLIAGSPDAFGGIGLNIAPGQIANSGDTQLFLYDLSDKQATPLTKDFNPSIDRFIWNRYNSQIYILAKDRDYVRLYSIDPVKKTIKNIPTKEDVLSDISIATRAPEMVYSGMGGSSSQRLYALEFKKDVSTLLVDLSAEILKGIKLGEQKDWNFASTAGDTIYGRYYLPPDFDPNKKYPLLVNYYAGTTPTARVLESRYPSHVYAGLGYVVYVIQPSGATGFGQEFSARHVNTWGIQTADEIIEGTEKFCEAHSFVNKDKIGCFGASYGGFMTMYLQTKTDIFTAAMSHAGISDITSYWGEGYWGYSYSAQASADSYPWNARNLYVDQSPLFSADKINTPILFLHGSEDTNVPIGESVRMFTALKLLGKETALVQVEGENHQIFHYDKRIKWNNTIYAWFAKWLKDEPEWWDALYPKKNL